MEQKRKLTKKEIDYLREKFIHEFCKKKGWNPDDLSTSQMLRIVKEENYKSPKITN